MKNLLVAANCVSLGCSVVLLVYVLSWEKSDSEIMWDYRRAVEKQCIDQGIETGGEYRYRVRGMNYRVTVEREEGKEVLRLAPLEPEEPRPIVGVPV